MIAAPEEDVLTLERVKNQITMGESEVRRIRDLKESIQQEVDQLVKDRKWYVAEIERLKTVLPEVRGELAALLPSIKEAHDVADNAHGLRIEFGRKEEQLERQSKLAAQKLDLDHAALDEREKQVSVQEESLRVRHDEHRKRESALSQRILEADRILSQLKAV